MKVLAYMKKEKSYCLVPSVFINARSPFVYDPGARTVHTLQPLKENTTGLTEALCLFFLSSFMFNIAMDIFRKNPVLAVKMEMSRVAFSFKDKL